MATLEDKLAALISSLGTDFKLNTRPNHFTLAGVCSVRTGKLKVVMLGSGLIVAVKGYLDTVPTGATTFKVDVNLNGSTIYAATQSNQPTWVASSHSPTVGSHSVTTFADGDLLSVDIDAVGSTVPGSDLTVSVYTLRTGN